MNRSVAAAGRVALGERVVLQDLDALGNHVAPAAKDRFGDRFRQPLAGAHELGNDVTVRVRSGSFGPHASLRSGEFPALTMRHREPVRAHRAIVGRCRRVYVRGAVGCGRCHRQSELLLERPHERRKLRYVWNSARRSGLAFWARCHLPRCVAIANATAEHEKRDILSFNDSGSGPRERGRRCTARSSRSARLAPALASTRRREEAAGDGTAGRCTSSRRAARGRHRRLLHGGRALDGRFRRRGGPADGDRHRRLLRPVPVGRYLDPAREEGEAEEPHRALRRDRRQRSLPPTGTALGAAPGDRGGGDGG